ncbi:hypothetical protein BDV93DRAFT_547504 [Ceratobasidium sp. AG-I]|nr:hypothetical protein BDV93DRAFT_547504 [Ceratobasidium sp. AG-I]
MDQASRLQWFVQRSGEGYRFKNCSYGYYITIDSTEWSARAYLGRYPPTWQILQHEKGVYIIQYGDADRVLDMHPEHEPSGGEIHVWPKHDLQPQKQWMFEWIRLVLTKNPGDEDEQRQREIETKDEHMRTTNQQLAEKDKLIAQLVEQLTPKNQQPIEQAALTSSQSQQLVEQTRELVDQGRRLVERSKELEERSEQLALKNEEMMRGYRELGDRLAWVDRNERALRGEGDGSRPNEIDIRTLKCSEQNDTRRGKESEVATLREKMMDKDIRNSNDMP